MGGDRLLGWLLGAEEAARVEPLASPRRRELFLNAAEGLRPLPGARELVVHLVQRGVNVLLASSAAPAERDALLRVLDLPVEVEVTDSGDVEGTKPHPELLHTALARVNADAREYVMVEHARWDMEAARRAGVVGLAFAAEV